VAQCFDKTSVIPAQKLALFVCSKNVSNLITRIYL
jgi:hypothetical protein